MTGSNVHPSGMFTQDQAQALWDALCERCHAATLGFAYHERMMPAEVYWVHVPVGPGSFPAEKLRDVMAIADEHGCEAHLIGDGLRLLPKKTTRP